MDSEKFDLDSFLKNVKEYFSALVFKKDILYDYQEWTLVDLDNSLKGNMPIADFQK